MRQSEGGPGHVRINLKTWTILSWWNGCHLLEFDVRLFWKDYWLLKDWGNLCFIFWYLEELGETFLPVVPVFLSQFIASTTLDLSLLSLSRTWLYSLCLQWLAWCLPSPGLLWLFSLLITYVSRSLFKVTYRYEKQLQMVFEASHRQNLVLFYLVMIILMCGLSSVVRFYSENLKCSFFSLCIFFLRWNSCNKINHFKA